MADCSLFSHVAALYTPRPRPMLTMQMFRYISKMNIVGFNEANRALLGEAETKKVPKNPPKKSQLY